MVETYTISGILSQFSDFDKAFWTTYSIDFNTVDFVLKKDLKTIMSTCCFHLICDSNKLDESLVAIRESGKKLQKAIGLQEYGTISVQHSKGAFHPKIIFFASTKEILVIISSANATTSGILSNQDLAGVFVYRTDDERNKAEVASVYNYLKSFNGWCDEAKADFNFLSDQFPFLNEIETSDKVFTIPNQIGLLEQFEKQIKNKTDVKEIRIFSPSFDEKFAGISNIAQTFDVPINVFSPIQKYETILTEKLPDSIRFFSTESLLKKVFHAKFFEFILKDKSIVLWGSANCSYSGLINPTRNYEILLKQKMSAADVFSIWGDLKNANENKVVYLTEKAELPEEKHENRVLLLGLQFIDENFVIRFKGAIHEIEKSFIVGINTKNEKMNLDLIESNENEIKITYDPNLVIVFVEFKGEKISNQLFVNNSFAIASRLKGKEESDQLWKSSNGKLNLGYLFSRFNIDSGMKSKKKGVNRESVTGFWKMPNFFRGRQGIGVLNLDEFIKKRTNKFKNNKDDDEPGDEPEKPKPTKRRTPRESKPQSEDLLIKQQTKLLLANIKILDCDKGLSQINQQRWLNALFRLLHHILNNFELLEKVAPNKTDNLVQMLNNVCQVSVWMAAKFNEELLKDRYIEILRCIIDMYRVLALYQYARFLQFNFFDPWNEECLDLFTMAKRSFFYGRVIEKEFSEKIKFSEHNFLSVEDFILKLPNKRRAYKIFSNYQNNRWQSFEDVFKQSKAHPRKIKNGLQWLLLLKVSSQAYHFEDILGQKVNIPRKRKK